MSQVRDKELKVAYDANYCVTNTNAVYHSNYWFEVEKLDDWDEALLIDAKYVVLARYDENQYSSPPNMRMFGIFSSMDKAKDTMAVWAINRGLGNEMLATCTYDWVMIDGVNV